MTESSADRASGDGTGCTTLNIGLARVTTPGRAQSTFEPLFFTDIFLKLIQSSGRIKFIEVFFAKEKCR